MSNPQNKQGKFILPRLLTPLQAVSKMCEAGLSNEEMLKRLRRVPDFKSKNITMAQVWAWKGAWRDRGYKLGYLKRGKA